MNAPVKHLMTGEAVNPWRGLVAPDVVEQQDGLDTLTSVLLSLREGAPVPQRAAEHLAQALQPCLNGDNDIAGRLGLRAPRRGGAHEAPAALAKKLRRDFLIQSILAGMGGADGYSALALQALWAYYKLNPPCLKTSHCANPPKNFFLFAELAKDYDGPVSHRQILRIGKGEPAYHKRRQQ